MENIRDSKLYSYSSEEHKNEREIPPYMVAIAATAVSLRIIYIYLSFIFIIYIFALGLRHPATLPSQYPKQQY